MRPHRAFQPLLKIGILSPGSLQIVGEPLHPVLNQDQLGPGQRVPDNHKLIRGGFRIARKRIEQLGRDASRIIWDFETSWIGRNRFYALEVSNRNTGFIEKGLQRLTREESQVGPI